MACRGYFLALDDICAARVLAEHGNNARLIEVVKELDMTDAPDECAVDKAWDGIHRCLTEGKLGGEDGTYPLNAVVLSGLPLHDGDDYVVSYNTAAEVRDVAAALATVDMERFTAIYWMIDPDDFGAARDDDGLAYLTAYLADITAFYERAANAGWSTIFVVDQ